MGCISCLDAGSFESFSVVDCILDLSFCSTVDTSHTLCITRELLFEVRL